MKQILATFTILVCLAVASCTNEVTPTFKVTNNSVTEAAFLLTDGAGNTLVDIGTVAANTSSSAVDLTDGTTYTMVASGFACTSCSFEAAFNKEYTGTIDVTKMIALAEADSE